MRLSLLASIALVACTSEERAPFASVAVADAGASTIDGAVVPPVEAGAPSKLRLAFSRFYMGDTDRGGQTLGYAWEYFGEDFDGLHSNYLINGECRPTKEQTYTALDGINGYDNQWGAKLLPLLAPWDPTPSKASDDALKAGIRRPIITLEQLRGSLTGATLHASFTYLSAPGGQTEPELARYEASTFANGTFDSGPSPTPVELELTFGPQVMRMKVQRLRVHFDLRPDNTAVNGQLSGAIKLVDLQEAVVDHVGRNDAHECGGAKLAAIKDALTQAADVLADGRSDPQAECDAVSFGVGFEAEPVTAASGAAPSAPPLTPACQ